MRKQNSLNVMIKDDESGNFSYKKMYVLSDCKEKR